MPPPEKDSVLITGPGTHESEGVDSGNVHSSTYQMRPSLAEIFKTSTIKHLIQQILSETLQDKVYNVREAPKWTKTIADEVNSALRELNMRRYKHVVQVTLGQQLGSGCRYIARCRWDADCDSQASEVFTNASIFCVCTVFGVFLY